MIAARSFLAQTARWLCLLVLVNGWVCALGHGRMLAPLFDHKPPASHPHGGLGMGAMHGNMTGMPEGATHSQPPAMAGDGSMAEVPSPSQSPPSSMGSLHGLFSECFFAGSLPLALVLFALLGWLARHRRLRPPPTCQAWRQSPRSFFPGLNPQAP